MRVTAKYTFDEEPIKEFFVAIKEFARSSLVVGVVGTDANKMHPTAHGDLTVGEIATLQEFGSSNGHIPPRPFLRNTLMNKSLVLNTLAEAGRRVVHKYSTPRQAFKRAGDTFVNAIKTTLLDGVPPPNSPRTVAWKGHGDTLIGLTGALYDAISYQIRGGK